MRLTNVAGTPATVDEVAGWARGLSDGTKSSLTAALMRDIATPEEQRAAAMGMVRSMPDDAGPDVAEALVQGISAPDQRRAVAERVVGTLHPKQQQRLAESVLGRPDKATRQTLWFIVVWTMTVAVFVFGALAFVLIYRGRPAEAPLALATTALGGVVGLVATSPGSRSSE
ncbi:hypothetical protein [Streptomyces sp. CRN 30]|uniref:hypothetical protein n=1 Tax=Streptomyces sp. CRN 30 TaxID=3075613 RepID=UPI002A7FA5C2|nr:hypothetical protein [Streptomyces sp. CRN 30]